MAAASVQPLTAGKGGPTKATHLRTSTRQDLLYSKCMMLAIVWDIIAVFLARVEVNHLYARFCVVLEPFCRRCAALVAAPSVQQ